MKNEIEKLTFEQAMQELEILVRRLEEGRLPLEEAIQAYERGTALKTHCQSKLAAAKLKVDQIVVQPNGEIATKPFEPQGD